MMSGISPHYPHYYTLNVNKALTMLLPLYFLFLLYRVVYCWENYHDLERESSTKTAANISHYFSCYIKRLSIFQQSSQPGLMDPARLFIYLQGQLRVGQVILEPRQALHHANQDGLFFVGLEAKRA